MLSSSPLSGSLVIVGSPVQSEQIGAAEEARLRSPGAIIARKESRTRFAHLGASAAASVAGEAFPGLIHERDGGPPKLRAGQRITGYVNARAARVALGGKENGVIQSLAPMAVATTHGWSPVDLNLHEVGGAYTPEDPVAGVRIPKHLNEGVRVPASGLSLTPVNAKGAPLSDSGSLDGAAVFFANTQADADTIIKPSTLGFAVDTVLRSPESPEQLSFEVGLPSGASLVSPRGRGPAQMQVIKDGATIATIPMPVAHDAAGTPVPVSMKAVGDVLRLKVDANAGEFQYPIDVDPEFNTTADKTLTESTWEYKSYGAGFYHGMNGDAWLGHTCCEGSGSQWAELAYQTTGDSKIYEATIHVDGIEPTEYSGELYFTVDNVIYLALTNKSGPENSKVIAQEGHIESPPINEQICPAAGCGNPEYGAEGNAVALGNSLGSAPDGDQVRMNTASVSIAQPKATHSTVAFDTEDAELAGTANVLYGGGSWMSSHTGALKFTAADKGVGIANIRPEYYNSSGLWSSLSGSEKKYLGTSNCRGIQCSQTQTETLNFANLEQKGLLNSKTNGEQRIRFAADDAMEHTWSTEYGEGEAIVKVDTEEPHGLAVTGLPGKGEVIELGEVETHIKGEASDGVGSGESAIPASGVKAIALYVDGREVGRPSGPCTMPKGACTAHAEWSLNGAELGSGTHTLTIVATDNAYNVETKEYTLHVYPASPVAMGPGSVNPESGNFALEAADVGVSGGVGSLAVTRHYDSLNLKEGIEGPLGPDWNVSLGSLASLEALPDKSVMVVGPEGLTHFSVASGGGFSAPTGDTNLKLEAKENENKEITEYLLKNSKKGTTTRFTLPNGAKLWMPTVSEGPIPTNTVTDSYQTAEAIEEYATPASPVSIAPGPEGNLWFTQESKAIGELTPTGYKKEFSSLPTSAPGGIAEETDGNVWFTNLTSNKVDKLTPAGVLTEYESSGNGEWGPIAEGSDGNVWLTHRGGEAQYPGTIVKLNTSGEKTVYSVPQESNPEDIVPGPEGDMWFTNGWCRNVSARICRIGKITPTGAVTEYPLERWALPEDIVAGPEGERAVWFAMTGPSAGEAHIVKMTSTGAMTKYALPTNSYPRGITVGPDGNLWFTEWESNVVGKITPSGTITEYQLPVGSHPHHIVAGPDGKLWFTEAGSNHIGTISTSGKIVEPALEVAPHPTISCSQTQIEKLEASAKGCRALKFTYAKATTATGEKSSEWGEFNRRLMKVSFIAYNTSAGKMESNPVAEYAYDQAGRLRAEWNPQASSELKTTYGYDAEGHITALTSPGQQPWAFTYGTIAANPWTGMLVKVTQAQPKSGATEKEITEKLTEQKEAPKNTEAPKISGTPAVGVRMAVSKGTWSNSPVMYGFQWYDCSASGSACAPILGATNPNYTAVSGDVGHELIVKVTATNGGGSAWAYSAASTVVLAKAGVYTQAIDSGYSLAAVSCVSSTTDCVQSDSAGKGLYTTNVSSSTEATWKTWNGPNGQGISPSQAVDCPTTSLCLLADGKETAGGKLFYATSLGGAWTEAVSPSYGVDAISCGSSSLCVEGQDGEGYFRYSTNPASTSWTLEQQGSAAMKAVFCLSTSFCAIADGAGKVHIATSTSKIESSNWKETDVDGSTALNGIACTSTTKCVAVDGVGNALKLTIESTGVAVASKSDIDGTNNLTAVTCTGSSLCIAVDNAGNVFMSKNSGETWKDEFTLGNKLTSVSCASSSLCVAGDTIGNATAFNPTFTATEGEAQSPQPGSTIEYSVPTSGTGAPHSMTKEEIAKWGQKESETPAYAFAIFPSDEPQGWPASSYKRATVTYLDSQARAINTAFPTGGISTREYNEENQVTRSLSVDNRAAALKEECKSEKECKSAEVANLLSTTSTYNGEGQLIDSWGPQHMAKLAHGKEGKSEEVLARNHIKYHYNEGAKEAEEKNHESYEQVTKTEDGAETASKEEFDKRVTTTSYSGQGDLGWKLREPTSTTVDPGGLNLTTTTVYEEETGNVIETRMPGANGSGGSGAWAYSTQFGNGDFSTPFEDAVDAHGNIWVANTYGNNIQEFSASGSRVATYDEWGSGNTQVKEPIGIAVNTSNGNVYVGDDQNNRVQELNEKGEFIRTFGWGVSNGEAKFEICTSSCQTGSSGGGAGQFHETGWITVDSSGNVWVGDEGNNRVQEFNEKGEFIRTFGWGVSNGENKLEVCTSSCHAGIAGSGNGQLSNPTGIAVSGGHVYVADLNNARVEEFSTEGSYITKFGTSGSGEGQLSYPAGVAIDSSGNVYVADSGNGRAEEFTSGGSYVGQIAKAGTGNNEVKEPLGVALDSSGNLYIADAGNNRIVKWAPGNGNPEAHDKQTSYYTAKEEASVPTCRNHPEWASLVCQTAPKAQSGVSNMPELPVTTISYNMWDQPEKTEETFGTGANAKTRTKKTTYNAAGGVLTSEVTSSPANDIELPQVVNTYNKTTGMLEEQSTKAVSGTKTTVVKYNTLGQLATYTDADGNTATFEYEPEKDGRLVKFSDSKGNQTYHYNETTGFLTELVDSAAGAFKAEYDLAGKLTTETYPNAMTATYTHNQAGEMTTVEYKKTAHCEKTCPEVWFSDTTVPSIHGETVKQNSTLSEEPNYTYDNAGRLTQAQEIPAGEGCKTRIYAYDEEGNRTSETTREPAAEGKCASEGGSIETHAYDTANQMTDPGVIYEAFGNTTKLPAADAGGSELVSEYYVDSQVAKQEQGGEKIEYKLDPEDRTRETISSGNTASTVITHYDGSGGAVAWTGEGSGETQKWTRNIPNIDGTLTATQSGEGKTGKPAVLLLHDLQGNVVAEAGVSETETKLLKKYNSTEFGVPSGKGAPPKYAWLGASGVAGELPSGVITQDGVTYVPQTGRPLQTESVVLAAIVNTPSPLDKPIEEWVGIRTGEGGALLVAVAEQKRAEREAANHPSGAMPEGNPGWWCGEEYGPCPETGEVEGGEGSGCSGMQACTSSNRHYPSLASAGCSVEAFIKTGQQGTVAGSGLLGCAHHKAKLDIKVCIYVVGISPGEHAALSCENKPAKNAKEVYLAMAMSCERGRTYFTYAWGYVFGESNYEGYIGYVRSAEGGNESNKSSAVCNIGVDIPPGVGE